MTRWTGSVERWANAAAVATYAAAPGYTQGMQRLGATLRRGVACLGTGVNPWYRLFRTFRARRPRSSGAEHPPTQRVDPRAAICLALDELESRDLALDGSGAPRQAKSGLERGEFLAEAFGEGL